MWALGKQHGFITPVQLFRDRWECSHIGTVIFAVQAALLVPYIVIGVMGGGTMLEAVSGGRVPFWLGGALVALVVMSYVFFGGMRGTAWVNTFQTLLFLVFGLIAVAVIGTGMGGFSAAAEALLGLAGRVPRSTRERVSPLVLLQLHVHPPVRDRLSPHHDLLPHRAADVPVQEDGRSSTLCASSPLAALRVPGRHGEPGHGHAGDRPKDGGPADAGGRRAAP